MADRQAGNCHGHMPKGGSASTKLADMLVTKVDYVHDYLSCMSTFVFQHLTQSSWSGRCCDATEAFLPEGSPPHPAAEQLPNDWSPYDDHTQFEFTEFVYTQNQMPASQITELLNILAASLLQYGGRPFFASSEQLYRTIDKTLLGDIKWEQLSVHYTRECPPDNIPPWMDQTWEDAIAEDPETHGSAFVPIILGSDKTTVLVAMSQNDYYPLYMSIGNFRRQLFHSSLSMILQSLKPDMSNPEVTCFGDSYYHRVIYGLGPYIADYEEQVLLSCIVCNWCAKCLAHRNNLDVNDALFWCREYTEALIAAGFALDALWNKYRIIIKGSFKDHLVKCVEKYLKEKHGVTQANVILDNIDCQIAVVTPFTGLWHFPQGCHFKQWTGDDSKALMKVYLPAIEGHIPRNVITEDTIIAIQDSFNRFHKYREVFRTKEVISTFSLPCQHSMTHYIHLIHLFGAPNGLCSSITELKHIKAVKELYHHTNHHNTLGQMGTEAVDDTTSFEAHVQLLAVELNIPNLQDHIQMFLYQQQHPDEECNPEDIPRVDCPVYNGKISVFNSASAMFYALSDISGIGGMWCEYIQSCASWMNNGPRYNCAFISMNKELQGMCGMEVAHIHTFFSFAFQGKVYPCAVVWWFDHVGNKPDDDTGMWIVRPVFNHRRCPATAILHLHSVCRAAHLIPVYGSQLIPLGIELRHSYNTFQSFYVNKFTDHHAFEVAL
ncbi:hypothetical protein BDN67DRAFT_991964 [Paxillus ammoniavirescens]|nr:hypothetical protein BDN67DRAFT_991964 [Paxillus ammoniavirescens]